MPAEQINSFNFVGNKDVDSLMQTVDWQGKSACVVSLTNYLSNDKPEISAGSFIEVNGGRFVFKSNESIDGSPFDGDVYIKLVPTENSETEKIDLYAEFTNTSPTWKWDQVKSGWYEDGTNNIYIPFSMTKEGELYKDKCEFYLKNNKIIKFYANGNLYIEGSFTVGEMNMYAFGELVLDDFPPGEKFINIKKPCRVFLKYISGSGGGQHGQSYISLRKGSGWVTIQSTAPYNADQEYLEILPGEYRFDINHNYNYQLICTYCEGVSELNDATKIIEII